MLLFNLHVLTIVHMKSQILVHLQSTYTHSVTLYCKAHPLLANKSPHYAVDHTPYSESLFHTSASLYLSTGNADNQDPAKKSFHLLN